MVRWHASSCTDPVISIKDSEISCQNCSATYSFDQHSVPQNAAADLSIPPDRPLGQLRLRWPPSVPYTTDEELDMLHSATATIGDKDKSPVSSERTSEHASQFTIYRQLDVGQFRLICLYSAESHDDLIHLDLEQYNLDDCPEYEATSYAWGGEDGDSKPSGPIFIGKFYDVAFQTKNCLAMLRYLRPTRGVRMVWIDAICIDQSNMRERAVQVAEMRTIYRNASRVVVYLGPDTVLQPTQQHRRRSFLDESRAFQANDGHTSKELLSHRYFSRVWVIQELLLSKSLLIPLHSSDYHADSACIKRLNVDWNSTEAPWFEHIAGGRVFFHNELRLLLEKTWSSEATDPRDKVFGILGLLNMAHATANSRRNLDYSLLPDYTLSVKETFIGLMGYIMTTLDQRHILEHASGQRAAPGYPTWLPDMRDRFIWSSPTIATRKDCDQVQDWYKTIRLCCNEVWTITSGFEDEIIEWRHMRHLHIKRKCNAESFSELRAKMSVGNSTNESLFIHSSTAALSIKLIRIIRLFSRPRRIADFGSLRMFDLLMAEDYYLLLCTDLIDLDLLLSEIPTWLFLQDTNGGPIAFFLRESPHRGRETAYELVCCCRCWDLLTFYRLGPWLVNDEAAGANLLKGNDTRDWLMKSRSNDICPWGHSDYCVYNEKPDRWPLSWTLPVPYRTLYASAGLINPDSELNRDLLRAIPDVNLRVKDILPIFQFLADVKYLDDENIHQFGELYISIMKQSSSVHCSMESPCDIDYPRLGHKSPGMNIPQGHANMFFTFDPAIWASYNRLLDPSEDDPFLPFIPEVFVNQKITKVVNATLRTSSSVFNFEGHDITYCKPKREQWSSEIRNWMGWNSMGVTGGSVNEQATVYVCIPLHTIAFCMCRSQLGTLFRHLVQFRTATGQDETTMALNVKEKYRSVFAHSWPESLREEIGLIGEPCRVQIL